MFTSHPLDILFLTNFSDYCFRSIPAIAQLADTLKIRLTLMNVYDPKRCTKADAEAQVNSFFPEADRYATCQRLAVPLPLVDAVQRHLNEWPVNLILAPASDTFGLPRLGAGSTRSRLIRQCGVPVWTIGRRVELQGLNKPVRNVACWLDFHSSETAHLAFAIEYARKTNAKLHLMRALPVADEALLYLGKQNKALEPGRATEEILRLCASSLVHPEVHITHGESRHALSRLLRDCAANVVFLPAERPSLTEWMGLGLPLGDHIPCPSIYVGDGLKVPVWNLETLAPAAHPATVPNRTRPDLAVVGSRNGVGGSHKSWLSELGLA